MSSPDGDTYTPDAVATALREPLKIGDLVILNGEVTYTGRTSMEAEVNVLAENPVTRQRSHTNTAYLVYVALDDNGRPTEIPQLKAETEAEQHKLVQAKERQERRLKEKKIRESQ